MDKLRVRAYNVLFGDAFLITVPDRTADGEAKLRHILVDVGNALGGKTGGGEDRVFKPVIQDILAVLDGEPLDLYVMTHEHMDHVQGLFYAATKLQPPLTLSAGYAWLTASSAPEYYDNHPDAQEKRLEARKAYLDIEGFADALTAANLPIPPAVNALMVNNNPRSTRQCVEYLRTLAGHTAYVHRGYDLNGTHPFQEVDFSIWGPEEDTSIYYGRFRPVALGVIPAKRANAKPKLNRPIPPPGVDASAFYDLVDARRNGYVDNLLAIDRAANNTSIVFCLKWRGWNLLFPGDAEIRSWKTMNKFDSLEAVHFLKVSHHGSHNGTPSGKLLEKILPASPTDSRQRQALVSTYPGTYNNVPDKAVVTKIKKQSVQLRFIHEEVAEGEYIDIEFPAVEDVVNPGKMASSNLFNIIQGEIDMSENDPIKICIDRVLPDDMLVAAAERAVEENPTNRPVIHFSPGLGIAPLSPFELAALTAKKWDNGRTLRVRFLDGDPVVQNKLQPFAHQWSDHANIKLVFGDDPDAEIRISFKFSGSWSYLGTDALGIPKDKPTMNFGWLTPTTADDEYSRVVIHEFGHALGCYHEHQNPSTNIPWDKEAVYKLYGGPPNNWSKAQVDQNLFRKYSRSISQFSEFDEESIMLYAIPNALTIGDFEVGWNRDLSGTDKSFVKIIYPKQVKSYIGLAIDARPISERIGAHGEVDVFKFTVANQGKYRIETSGWTDVVMTLSGPDDDTNQIGEDDDSGFFHNARIVADLTPGTYYVRVRHFRPRKTGRYWISVRLVK